MSTNVRKRTLAKRVTARRKSVPFAETLGVVDGFLEEIARWVGLGHEVELRGFGSFRLYRRRSPGSDGRPDQVGVSFRPSQDMRRRLRQLAEEIARREGALAP